MAWTDYSTGDVLPAAGINDIHQAWNGTAGKAQAMSLTEVDDAANYAFDARNKDATNSLIARFRNATETVFSVVKEAVNVGKQLISTVADGTAPLVVTSTTKVDNLHVARATLADTVAANSVGNAGLRQSGALTVVGRSANSTGNVADIGPAAAQSVLRRSGDTLGFGTITAGGIADRTRTIWVGAGQMMAAANAEQTPVGANVAAPTIMYPDAETTWAYGSFVVPSDYTSDNMTAKVWIEGTAGNVRLTLTTLARANGEDSSAAAELTASATITISGNNVTVGTLSSAVPVAAGDVVKVTLARIGANAADTAAGNVWVWGVEFQYTADS